MLQAFQNHSDLIQVIKDEEVETGHLGEFFLTHQNDVFDMVKLTIENGFLIVNGHDLLDLSKIDVLIDVH